MSGIAIGAAARAVRKGDVKTVFFWVKIILAFLLPPGAVAIELHSFDSISIAVMVVALILWLLGWLPGVAFALFIILSSTGKKKVLDWFKSNKKPAADAEAGAAKPAAAKPAAAAPAPAAKPEVKVVAPAAPAAPAAKAPAAAAPAAPAAPAAAAKAPAPSGGGGWFGGGVNA